MWVDAWSASLRDPVLVKVLAHLQDQWTAAISAAIDDGVSAGTFSSDNSYDAATRLTAFLDGLAVRALVHHERISRVQMHGWLLRQVGWELAVDERELATGIVGPP